MARNITVTFADGTSHVYKGAPDDITPTQVQARAEKETGKKVTAIDGGKKASEPSFLSKLWTATKGDVGAVLEGIGQTADFLTSPTLVEAAARLTPAGAAVAPLAREGAKALNRSGITGHAAESVTNVIPETKGVNPVLRTALNFAGGMVAPVPEMKAAEQAPAVLKMLPKGLTAGGVENAATKATVPLAEQVVKAGANEGVNVLTSDVKPPTTFIGKQSQAIGERIPVAGTGGVRAAQQAQRVEAVKNLLRDYGGEAVQQLYDETPSAIDDVAANLSKTRGAAIKRLTAVKSAVINGVEGDVPVPNTIEAIGQQIRRLQDINPEKFAPVIKELQDFGTALTNGKSLAEIEGNRKLLGDMFKDPNLASIAGDGQKAVNAIYDPLRQDMGNYIKEKAGDAAFARWKDANSKLSSMMGDLDATSFKTVLKNTDVTPEGVGRLLFSKNPSDVRRLYANLDNAGKARAQAAIIQRAYDRAISADGGLSVERFANNLDGLSKSIGVVFQGIDKARIEGMTRLLNATRRAAGASAMPPTGVQNTPIVVGYSLASLFGHAAIPVAAAGGVLARVYESAPMRNLLVRLSATKPGSAAERSVMQKIGDLAKSQPALRASIAAAVKVQPNAVNDVLAQSPGRAAAQDEPNAGPEPPQ